MTERRRACLTLAAALLFVIPGHAGRLAGQAPAPRPEPLLVDFLALARDGRPVTDLKADELTLRIDGRQRQIRSLQVVLVGDPALEGPAGALMPPPYGANDAAETGRSIMIVFEDESIIAGNEQMAKEAIGRFLNKLGTRDRVGILTVPHGGVRVGMTNDHGRVRQALAQIYGRGSRSESDADAACRSRDTLQALGQLLGTTRAAEGPLTVLFFSASMVGGRGAEAPTAGVSGAALASRRCELNPEEFTRVGIEAAAARAYVYVIQPDLQGLRNNGAEPTTIGAAIPRFDNNPRSGLEHLSGVTGGRLLQLTGTDDTLNRVGLETSAFYVAAIEPEPGERNGVNHQLSVRASRAGVSVFSRPDVIIPRPVNPGLAPTPPPASARELLLQGRVYRDLPLRGIGYPSRNTASDITVLSLMESLDPTASLRSAAMGLFDANGRLVSQWEAREADLSKRLLAGALAVPSGAYRLRVAAIDTMGRLGTADYELAAELTSAGPLKMSALVLGLSRNGGFEPRLLFGNEPAAMAYLEIYGRPAGAGAQVTLALELASSLNGRALVTVPGALSSTSEPDKFVVNAAIPIGALPSGDFVVRAIVGVEGQPEGRVYRTFRKVQ